MSALLLAALLALPPGSPHGHGRHPAARAAQTGVARGAQAPLRQAVTAAVERDADIAAEALWTDRVPAGAARTLAGPALAALGAAAAARRVAGVRVRLLRSRLRVLSLRLEDGGTRARVVARWQQELAPSARAGVRPGRPLALTEVATLTLRRSPRGRAFLVWGVELEP